MSLILLKQINNKGRSIGLEKTTFFIDCTLQIGSYSSDRIWNISRLWTSCGRDPGVGWLLDDLHAGGGHALCPGQICPFR